jgi:hypothetical protein
MNPANALPSKLSSFTVPTLPDTLRARQLPVENPGAFSTLSGAIPGFSGSNNPSFKPKKKTMLNKGLNAFHGATDALRDVKDTVRATGQAVNAVNPAHYAYLASKALSDGTYVSSTNKRGTKILAREIVGYINVIHFVFFLLSWIFWAVSWLSNIIIWVLILVITLIINIIGYLIAWSPAFIVFFLIGLVCQKLWDVVLTPIIEGLILSYNSVIREWNVVADALRWVGFHVPIGRILGHDLGFDIGFKLLDLPYGTEASVNLVTFRKFVVDILFFAIVKPILNSTNGYIFRNNAADISVDEFNDALGA